MNKIRLVVNNEVQKKSKEKFFIKKELQSILDLYAKMVSNGSWKDYSFTSGVREVSFNVYQRASDKPVLRILKNLKPQYFNERYLIKDKNGIILKKSEDLNQLINKTSWNKLNFRWAYFFVFLAILNEVVWRTQPETTWVNFKVWGMLPITIIFTAMQLPLINCLLYTSPSPRDS